MADGVDQHDDEGNIKVTKGGSLEFSGAVDHPDPNLPRQIPAPDGTPEKFWDPIEGKLRTEDLLKSYQELEKTIGSKKSDKDDEPDDDDVDDKSKVDDDDDEDKSKDDDKSKDEDKSKADDDKDEKDDDEDSPQAAFAAASEAAAKVYAEKGELDEKAREPLKALGISDQQIDLYLNGVKATEAALHSAAVKAAGSEEVLKAAQEWAAENWSDKKKLAFNAQTGDVETVGTAYEGLMAEFRKANPGEGKLQRVNGGVPRGDVYDDMEDFREDLKAADLKGSRADRKRALDKLRRSKAAGTIKSHRRQPFGG